MTASTRCRRRAALAVALLVVATAALVVLGRLGGGSAADGPAAESLPEAVAGTDGSAGTDASGGEAGADVAADAAGDPAVGGLGVASGGLTLPEATPDGPVSREAREVSLGVQAAAEEVLGEYRARGDAVLVRAGWLDLLGSVWGCVVSGPGWVEVCVVGESGQASSSVEVLRMEAEEWERAYGDG